MYSSLMEVSKFIHTHKAKSLDTHLLVKCTLFVFNFG
jgi:hypothetical protein